jgi:hypothetical protein
MFRRGIKGDTCFNVLCGCNHLLGGWLGLVFVVNTLWKLYSCRFFVSLFNFYLPERHGRRRMTIADGGTCRLSNE